MKELLRRLGLKTGLALKLLGSTFLLNVLGFASPVFVMLILDQYINSGFDGTLYTLSLGMLLVLLLQGAFRELRTLMAARVSREPDRKLASAVFDILSRARSVALERLPPETRRQAAKHLETVQAAYNSRNVLAVYDAPFSLMFVLATWLISGTLAVVALFGVALTLGTGLRTLRGMRRRGKEMQRTNQANRAVAMSAVHGADTVRAFGGGAFLEKIWQAQSGRLLALRRGAARVRGRTAFSSQISMTLVRLVLYAVGAKMCVAGHLSVAGLIVANILVGRALRLASGFVGAASAMSRAGGAMEELGMLFKLPVEPERGTALREYSGRVEFKDLSFAFPGSTGPLFESLSLRLDAGSIVVVHGPNGSGKTTLARMAAGLLPPMRGDILADGINLRQMAPDWWRQQLVYLPQEPDFLNGSIRRNLTMANPDLPEEELQSLVKKVGLDRFLAATSDGLETMVTQSGRAFPLGARRRMALVRALATGGRLVILDEPVEGLDEDGVRAVVGSMVEMARQGRTILVFTHDPGLIKGAHYHVDLGVKPVPRVSCPPDGPLGGADRKTEGGHGQDR